MTDGAVYALAWALMAVEDREFVVEETVGMADVFPAFEPVRRAHISPTPEGMP